MKYQLLTLYFSMAVCVKAQHIAIKKVDSLLVKTWVYHSSAKLLPTVVTGIQSLNPAKKSTYDKGMAERHLVVTDALIKNSLHKELKEVQGYLDQSMALVKKRCVSIYLITVIYFAKLESKQRNLRKAIDYYYRTLADTLEISDEDALRNLYKMLSRYYRHRLDLQHADGYLLKYNSLDDSLPDEKQQVIDLAVRQILKSKENEGKIEPYMAFRVYFSLLLVGLIAYFWWNMRRKHRLLRKHQIELSAQEFINRELSEQIEENKFGNLIVLAKNNSPEFLTLFCELYPEFIESLRVIDPKIRSSELEFCAMAYLNFSAKNIAEYTFVTVRAVQIRKNRLRKKFNISSGEDFNRWMRERTGSLTSDRR